MNNKTLYVLNVIVSMFDAQYGYQSKTHNAFLNDNYEIERFLDSVDGVTIYYNGLQMSFSEKSKIDVEHFKNVIRNYYLNEIKNDDFYLVILNGEGLNLLTKEGNEDKHEYKFQVGINEFISAKEIYSCFEGHLNRCSCGLIINSCNMDATKFITNLQGISNSNTLSNWDTSKIKDFIQKPLSKNSILEKMFQDQELESVSHEITLLENTPEADSENTKLDLFITKEEDYKFNFPILIAGLSSKNVIFQNLEFASLTYGGAIIKGWNAMQLNLQIRDIFTFSKSMLNLNSDKTIYYPSLSILCNSQNEWIARKILNQLVFLNRLKDFSQ